MKSYDATMLLGIIASRTSYVIGQDGKVNSPTATWTRTAMSPAR